MSIFYQVVVAAPVYAPYDYLPPEGGQRLQAGQRVLVPFGRSKRLGIVIGQANSSSVPNAKLKAISKVLDNEPLYTPALYQLLCWCAKYYHHPLGEVLISSLPVLLRQLDQEASPWVSQYALSEQGQQLDESQFSRAVKQRQLWQLLKQHPEGLLQDEISQHQIKPPTLKTFLQRGWLMERQVLPEPPLATLAPEPAKTLTSEQQQAVQHVSDALDTFKVFLLEGITGSGKTEVYLQCISQVLAKKQQVLVLVPEIGLTPQTVARFKARFQVPVVVMHSGLNDKQRLLAWWQVKRNKAAIVIGTRSALLTPFAQLGLIIIDESHDGSFKQFEGFRYSARDVAIRYAQGLNIPIVLGTATPSLESLANASRQRYCHLQLTQRAGEATPPTFRLIDVRNQRLEEGLSEPLIQLIQKHLAQGGQVLLFLNRRGYAPVLLCHQCGWMAQCLRCDARLTFHRHTQRLHCHHCDSARAMLTHCPACQGDQLLPLGIGTQRLDEILKQRFPHHGVIRVDRDNTRTKGALDNLLKDINQGKSQLLVGTQMLAKGHHFPNLTLVAVLDADSGFFSADFRANEKMAQLLIQVAGRAGRGDKKGEVVIQTHNPEHPMLQALITEGYQAFATLALREREQAQLPPFSFLALIRASANKLEHPLAFLKKVAALSAETANQCVSTLGPIPAPMAKRAGQYRAQLLLQANHRQQLQQQLDALIKPISELPEAKKVRWSIDVDPLEMY